MHVMLLSAPDGVRTVCDVSGVLVLLVALVMPAAVLSFSGLRYDFFQVVMVHCIVNSVARSEGPIQNMSWFKRCFCASDPPLLLSCNLCVVSPASTSSHNSEVSRGFTFHVKPNANTLVLQPSNCPSEVYRHAHEPAQPLATRVIPHPAASSQPHPLPGRGGRESGGRG